jgi:uncharacterized protein YoxC
MPSIVSDEFARMVNTALRVIEIQSTLIQTKLTDMANTLDDYIAAQTAANEKINTAVAGVTGDVAELKHQIEELAKGAVTAEQASKLSGLAEAAGAIVSKLEALDAGTPAVPDENVAGLNPNL